MSRLSTRALIVRLFAAWAMILNLASLIFSFAPNRQTPFSARQTLLALRLAEDETQEKQKDMNPFTRASWYAVEAFGKAFGGKSAEATATLPLDSLDLSKPPQSLKETLQRIQLDNDRSYFLSGEVDKLIYEKDCVFADPFVSFSGRDRFVENLANLGSFITKYSARMLDYKTLDDTTVKTKVMVKLRLNLPWKPVLAWPWGVTYEIDPSTYLITRHEETWDIEPWEGVKQIFRKTTTDV